MPNVLMLDDNHSIGCTLRTAECKKLWLLKSAQGCKSSAWQTGAEAALWPQTYKAP